MTTTPQHDICVALARSVLYRIARNGLPPTPENYAKVYSEIAAEAEVRPEVMADDGYAGAELLAHVRNALESVSGKTSGLITDLSERNQEMRHSIDDLMLAHDAGESERLLKQLVIQANSMHEAVDAANDDLMAARMALDHLLAELQETKLLVYEDALTGAQNRRSMEVLLTREISRARRHRTHLSVAMIDIDHFKQVNDRLGHDAGDRLLQHLAALIRASLRESDVLVRYGGEEFLLILPDTDAAGAEVVVGRLKETVQRSPFAYQDRLVAMTFSGGIAQLQPGENGRGFVVRADTAMYQAKAGGRNCFRIG